MHLKCTYTTAKKRTIDKVQANRIEKQSLRTLRNFNLKELGTIWHDLDIFSFALERTIFTKNRDYLAKILTWAADLIFYRMDEKYLSKSLATYARRYSLHNSLKPGSTLADFDNYLYDLAEKV